MAFDDTLAGRIRDCLVRHTGVEERTLFGCGCFLLNGHVLVGVWRESLIVRVGPDEYEDALLQPHVRVFDITGRPMTGWVVVEQEGVEDDEQLNGWVRRALAFNATLPAH